MRISLLVSIIQICAFINKLESSDDLHEYIFTQKKPSIAMGK